MIEFLKNHWILFLLLFLGATVSFIVLFINRKKIQIKTIEAIIFSYAHIPLSIVFCAFFSLLESGFDLSRLGSMSLFGSLFLMPIFYLLFALIAKKEINTVFNLGAICLCIGLMFARANCLIAGCCQGIILFGSAFRFPTRELEIIFYFAFIVLTYNKIFKSKKTFYGYPILLISYGALRFLIEWFRDKNVESYFHLSHIWAIGSLIIGLTLLIVLLKLRRSNINDEKIC